MSTPSTHPSALVLAPLLQKYPATSGCLFQVYNDLRYGQGWLDLGLLDLGERAAVSGRQTGSEENESVVVPCRVEETISYAWSVRSQSERTIL